MTAGLLAPGLVLEGAGDPLLDLPPHAAGGLHRLLERGLHVAPLAPLDDPEPRQRATRRGVGLPASAEEAERRPRGGTIAVHALTVRTPAAACRTIPDTTRRGYPFTTAIGSRRATRREIPESCITATTRLTSL